MRAHSGRNRFGEVLRSRLSTERQSAIPPQQLPGVRSWTGGLQRPCARLIWKLGASSGQWLWTLAGADSGKSVGAPFLAANAMMDSEKAVGIVFLLHGGQPGIV